MNEDQFTKIMEKLDFISRLLVLNMVNDKDFKQQVETLHNFGYKETDIVKMLNSTRDKVHVITRKLK